MDNGTFLCWMVKLTGSVKLVLFTDARMTVKTSEFISVLFSVRKYWWLSRLSIPLNVMKTTEAEPAPRGSKLVWKWERFCEGNAFVRNPASPLLALARACRFMSSVCPLADRATVLPSCSESSSFSGLMVCRLKSYREMKKKQKNTCMDSIFLQQLNLLAGSLILPTVLVWSDFLLPLLGDECSIVVTSRSEISRMKLPVLPSPSLPTRISLARGPTPDTSW